MILPTLVAIVLGMLISTQAAVNAQLRLAVGHPIIAAAISFVVGSLALLVVGAVMRVPLPSSAELSRAPWWSWTGGLLGAVYIAAVIVLAPRLGAAVLIASVVAGQLAAALVLDHYGLLGFAQKSVTLARATETLLLFAGVYLIQRR